MNRYIALLTRIIPDKIYLQIKFYQKFHRFIDFTCPETFNEKIQYLKLYDRKSEYVAMVDKYLAKTYVENKIGGGALFRL